MGKGVASVLQGRVSGARWAAGQTESSVQQDRASVADAKEDQHGAALWGVGLCCLGCGLEPASVLP